MLHFLKVSATQYALCLDGGICSTYCQTKERKAAGVCAGPTKWDCYCEDGDGNREPGRCGVWTLQFRAIIIYTPLSQLTAYFR